MEFVLVFRQPAEVFQRLRDAEKGPAQLEAWRLYLEAMASAGVLRGGPRLNPFTATAVRVRDGERHVQDGPFAESKDLLAGFVTIDVATHEEALRWAERAPSAAVGCTEVYGTITPDAR